MAEIALFAGVAFLAGVLSAFAPCVLPLVPVIIGGSASSKESYRPYLIILSLFVSIVLFSLLLKSTTLLLDLPEWFWSYLSGFILILFGVILAFPNLWEKFQEKFKLYTKSNKLMAKGYKKGGFWGAIIIGASLGPVFSSCSPVYLLILAVILPSSLAQGLIYIIAYSLGLSLFLLFFARLSQSAARKFGWLENPNSKFKKILGVIVILTGILFITGLDKQFQILMVDLGIYNTDIEKSLLEKIKSPAE